MFLTADPLNHPPLPHPSDSNKKYWCLSNRQLCDIECLLNGAYSPLKGFMDKENYLSVCKNRRLADGALWPIPITLDVSESFAAQIELGEQIILTDPENTPLALLTVSSKWMPDKQNEALLVFETTDPKHPGVKYLFEQAGPWYVGGAITALSPLIHYNFIEYRHTPAELKQLFKLYGWSKIIAFQTRNPIHRAHFELTRRASDAFKAPLLIHPVIGMTKPGDVEASIRIKCYEAILDKYPKQQAMLSLLPIAMRMAGPREALWHAIIRKNYGVTHFIVGRDHAGPGLNSRGLPFYQPYDAQTMLLNHADELQMEIVCFPSMVYVKEKNTFLTADETDETDTIEDVSGTELRRRLEQQLPIPSWFSFPEVIQILRRAYPPKQEQGFTVFFTGLSGAGKSTLAKALQAKLIEATQRQVSLLDGDIVRKTLSNELGFSMADRNTHIQRIGFVAAEITKHKGIAICAAIAPYTSTRELVRNMIRPYGGFIEIYVSTPLSVCRQRDIKGLYRKATLGLISDFTGIDSPYEKPGHPDLVIDTSKMSVAAAVDSMIATIHQLGFLPPSESSSGMNCTPEHSTVHPITMTDLKQEST